MLLLSVAALALVAAPSVAQDGDGRDSDQEEEQEQEEQEEQEDEGTGLFDGSRRGGFVPEFDPEFHPTYKLDFKRDQDVSTWTHNFKMNYSFTPKVAFTAGSNIVLRENEALNRVNRNEKWNAGLSLALSSAISTGIKFTRSDQEDVRNPGKDNEVRTFRERESFNLTTNYNKTLLSGIGVILGANGGFEKNKYSNVLSRGSSQGVTAGIEYDAPLGLSTRFQYSGQHSLLDSEQGALESKDESFDHSLTGHMEYAWLGNAFLVDVRRGLSSTEYPKEEQTEHRRADTEGLSMSADVGLVENLTSTFNLGYTRSKTSYRLEDSKDNDLKTRNVQASLSYSLGATDFTAEMSSEKKRNEYYDVQTGDQYSNAFGASVTHEFGEELSAVLRGRTSLLSHHYDDTEGNDQDRDLFDQEVTLNVDYDPRADISASLNVKVREDNLIYIRTSRTGDNKTSQTYSVKPSITKSFGDKITATQTYGLSADYTFYTYDPDSNFLIRNFSVDTTIDWRPFSPLRLTFSHQYRSQDEGSYVEDENGIEQYGKNSQRDDNSLELGVGYKLFGLVSLSLSQTLSMQKRWTIVDDEKQLSWEKFDTTLKGKANANYELESGTTVKFTLGRIYRDATNITDRQREVWDISLNIEKEF